MKRSRYLLFLIVLGLLIEPMLYQLRLERPSTASAQPETETEISDEIVFEPQDDDQDYAADIEVYESFDIVPLLHAEQDCLVISPQDRQALLDERVDVRVTRYLLSLVLPAPAGAGLCPVKAGRIFKNYDTDGIGRFDREIGSIEEGERTISAHHRGQAVDISEVGAIQCKLVERRRIGGSTTRWQSPKPIKVAWQSVDGIARNPTPKSPSLVETATTMSADSILRMLNESGEFDQYAQFVRGVDLPTIFTYIGSNIVLQGMGATKIAGDPMTDGLLYTLAGAMLEKNISDLPPGLVAHDKAEISAVAVARARIESELNLPPGSLRGQGWRDVLTNTGKRALENALGLPTLFFELNRLDQANAIETVRATLRYFAQGDEAFDVIDGTIDLIQKNDQQGLVLAGVNALATALNLSDRQRAELEAAARQNRTPGIRPESIAITKTVPLAALPLFFSDNPTEQAEARQIVRQLGDDFIRTALTKNGLREFDGIGSALYQSLIESKPLRLGEVLETIATRKLELTFGLDARDLRSLTQVGRVGRAEQRIADELNKEYGLPDGGRITAEDVDAILAGRDFGLAEKIGGFEIDSVLGWNRGTGLAVIRGDKSLETAAGEIFGNAFGQILGLRAGTEISLTGDIQLSYGRALLAQNLGIALDKPGADQYNHRALLEAFGLPSDRSLDQLKADESFWIRPEIVERLATADARIGAASGTSERFLRGDITTDQLSRRSATGTISTIAFGQLWNYFDLDEQQRLSKEDGQLLFDTLKDWENAPFEKKDRVFQLARALVGRSLDAKTGFTLDTFATYFTNPTGENAVSTLLYQGVRQLALSFGVNLQNFREEDLKTLTDRIIRVFNGTASTPEREALITQVLEATKIPAQYRADAAAFARGDFRTLLSSWSAAIWSDFANKYLPTDARLSYEEMRQVFRYSDEGAVNARATAILDATGKTSLTEQDYVIAREQARRELSQAARDNAQFKISDALLEQALGQQIPVNFSRRMMTGSDAERAALLLDFGFTQLDAVLANLEPSYQEGTLKKIYEGKLSARDADQLVLAIINRSGVSFGPFSATFMSQFYSFIRGQGRVDFFTNPDYSSMWSYLDSWLERTLGIGQLPTDLSRSIYYASKNGWRLDASLTGPNGQLVVPSLSQIGEAFLVNKLSQWGDQQFRLPAGSIYQMYRAGNAVISASQALSIARAAGDATKITEAAASLGRAQAELTAVIITIALNSCSACQQFFASVDQAIAAPPGFTNMAVSGAIAMALGLGPAGLIAAAVVYFVGVYRVDYLCPIPPPDRFSLSEFDPDYDRLDYTWGDHYADETVAVKDVPAPGENPFDWDDGLPFANGNDPNLWKAWARYNTGRLLDITIDFGEQMLNHHKPKQVVTLRRANAEYFSPRVSSAFGGLADWLPSVGLGYTQTTTKMGDSVHVAFGGLF